MNDAEVITGCDGEPSFAALPVLLICHEAGDVRRHNGAWFRVRWGIESHIDFRTRRCLYEWLTEQALTLCRRLPLRGERRVIRLISSRSCAAAGVTKPAPAQPTLHELAPHQASASDVTLESTASTHTGQTPGRYQPGRPTLVPRITSSCRRATNRQRPRVSHCVREKDCLAAHIKLDTPGPGEPASGPSAHAHRV